MKSKDIKILKIKPISWNSEDKSKETKGQSNINDYFLGCNCCVGVCKNNNNKVLQDFNTRLKNINKNYDEQAIPYFQNIDEAKTSLELEDIYEKANNNEKLSALEKAEIRKQAKLIAKKLVNNKK